MKIVGCQYAPPRLFNSIKNIRTGKDAFTVGEVHMYSLRVLGAQDIAAFREFTFPYFRSALTPAKLSTRMTAVGATLLGDPVGMVVAEAQSDARVAEIQSIGVAADQRHVGIGTALLRRIESELVARQCTWAEIAYMSNRPSTLGVEALLRKTGWPAASPRVMICRTDFDRLCQSPWMKDADFCAPFEVFRWKDLIPQESAAMKESQARKEWFPEALSPFAKERLIDPVCSLGLRFRGEIIGWCIGHQVGEDTLSCGCLFVKKEFEARGRAITLLAQAIHASRNTNRRKFIFGVSFERPAMIRFVQRRMAPYLSSIETTKGSRKQLIRQSSALSLQT